MSQEVLSITHKPKALPGLKSTKCERRAIRNSVLGRARRWISLLETKIFLMRRSWIRSNARLTHEWSYQPGREPYLEKLLSLPAAAPEQKTTIF
jgi:hypothetical protein